MDFLLLVALGLDRVIFMNTSTFPQRLLELRKSFGFSQQKLSEILFLGDSAISSYESGYAEPSFDTLIKMAFFFHVSTDYLLGVSDDGLPEKMPAFLSLFRKADDTAKEDILIYMCYILERDTIIDREKGKRKN